MGATPDVNLIDDLIRQRLDEILPQKLEEKLAERDANRTPSMCLIATKGTLDWAYPPFILSSTAAALGWDVSIFFTFYGLNLLKKDISDLKVSGLGNPAMPMKMPFGPDWFKKINWNIPNACPGGHSGIRKRRYLAHAADHQEQRRGGNSGATCAHDRSGREADRLPDDSGSFRLHARRFPSRSGGVLRRRILPADGAEGRRQSLYLSRVFDIGPSAGTGAGQVPPGDRASLVARIVVRSVFGRLFGEAGRQNEIQGVLRRRSPSRGS